MLSHLDKVSHIVMSILIVIMLKGALVMGRVKMVTFPNSISIFTLVLLHYSSLTLTMFLV